MNIAEAAFVVGGIVVRKAQGNGGVIAMFQGEWPEDATLLVKNFNLPGAEVVEDIPPAGAAWPE